MNVPPLTLNRGAELAEFRCLGFDFRALGVYSLDESLEVSGVLSLEIRVFGTAQELRDSGCRVLERWGESLRVSGFEHRFLTTSSSV